MSINVSNLTCFALLSAMESDLRDLISSVCEESEVSLVLPGELTSKTMERRAKERRGATGSSLSSLMPYIDFADAWQIVRRIADRMPPALVESPLVVEGRWERLVPARNRVAHSRPLEVDDLPLIVDFAVTLSRIEGVDWRHLKGVQVELERNPAFVLGLRPDLLKDDVRSIPHNLPPADFGETGFLGRRNQRRDLVKAVKGPWPVVSILGDGGLGKTALALQVAYDLLDDVDRPFEAVVWTSAKNATLTISEVARIEGAIQDSLGLFASAATELAGRTHSGDVVAEVLQYLETFRVLLVLDNLETVIDETVRTFLRDLPHGSKVLITSRIGVGTENPFKLSPMSQLEAKQLLRGLARVRSVGELSGLHDGEAGVLVDNLKCHPGYIKWFVSGIQAGQPAERLIEDNGLVLDFCMSNVFDYLGDDAKAVLRSMLVLPGTHTLAELAHLNDFSAARIQSSVLELTTTNFLTQVRGGAAGTGFSVSDFAKAYLQKRYPVPPEERAWLIDRHHDLYRSGGDLQEAHLRDPYSPETIDIRSAGDFHAARCLRAALDLSARGEFDAAIDQCKEAAGLAPGYHETHRIEAYVYEQTLSYAEAHDAYDRARDIAPDSPYVRYFFGRFLVASAYDTRQGLQELQRAARLDSDSLTILSAVSEAHVTVGNVADALEVCGAILEHPSVDVDVLRKTVANALLAATSGARICRQKRDWSRLAEYLELLTALVTRVAVEALQGDNLDRILSVEAYADEVSSKVGDEFLAKRCGDFASRLRERRRQVDVNHLGRTLGVVERIFPDKGFAFVNAGGTKFFLHATHLSQRAYFEEMPIGATVAFERGAEIEGQNCPALAANWIE